MRFRVSFRTNPNTITLVYIKIHTYGISRVYIWMFYVFVTRAGVCGRQRAGPSISVPAPTAWGRQSHWALQLKLDPVLALLLSPKILNGTSQSKYAATNKATQTLNVWHFQRSRPQQSVKSLHGVKITFPGKIMTNSQKRVVLIWQGLISPTHNLAV